jgi:hypothetical protein
MAKPLARDDDYCTALEQIKQMLAKYRPDVTHLRNGPANGFVLPYSGGYYPTTSREGLIGAH